MSLERYQFPATDRIPDFGRVIPASTDHPFPIWRKGHRVHPARVALERQQRPASGRIPHLDGPLPIRRGNPLPIWGEHDGKDRALVSLEREQILSGGRVPDLGDTISAARRHAPAIRREGDAARIIPPQGEQFAPGLRIP